MKWVCVRNWATLRLSDHCGLKQKDIQDAGTSLNALSTRSKTCAFDRNIASQPIVIDSCFRIGQFLALCGWSVLGRLAASIGTTFFSSIQHLPGLQTHELSVRCWTSVTELDSYRHVLDDALFKFKVAHSTLGQSIPPECYRSYGSRQAGTQVVRLTAQSSDRYALEANRRILRMQRLVSRAIHSQQPRRGREVPKPSTTE